MRARLALALTAATLLLAACSQRRREINGIGEWVLGKTILSDSHGICTPQEGDLTWCSNNPSIMLGDQTAAADLYFRGAGDKAKLVEILLSVRACDAAAAERSLVSALGEPSQRKDKQLLWRGRAAFIAAQLPAEARRCEVNFVSPDDKERIEDIVKGAPAGQ